VSSGTAMTLERLRQLVSTDCVAIRGKATLQPAGGPDDKVFPPSHMTDKNDRRPGAKYAFEKRHINGREVDCVLLDSVQSQANRMEEALQALWLEKRVTLPVITVDFSEAAPDVGSVTSLTAPHRIADALLRDSMTEEGEFFRMSPLGTSFTDATQRNASALFKVCPTALVFGLWDSTGPRGGLGSKFARALVSEIVGVGAAVGVRTSSRIDPTGIVTRAAEVLVAADPREGWTHDPVQARQEKGKPVRLGDGKVSEVNHSNVPPTIDVLAGGVTIEYATHTVVLSLSALRKLGFGDPDADVSVRTVLAALALVSVLAAEHRGHDLRSRCLLVPTTGQALKFIAIRRNGDTEDLDITLDAALEILKASIDQLPRELRFEKGPGEPLAILRPSPKLAHLVKKSRELAATGVDAE
jgi:CRISPR-associated protein Csb1